MASILASSPPVCQSSFPRKSGEPPSFSLFSLPALRLRGRSPRLIRCRRVARPVRAVEDETVVSEGQAEEVNVVEEGSVAAAEEQPVSVPVSPSDVLTMVLKAEGILNESAIPTVTKALQEIEGVGNVNVQVLEGIANVELKKQTTVQATGVASNLVEIIQGSGFKLQTLNLSFDEEEEE